jgi:hypothetical protein
MSRRLLVLGGAATASLALAASAFGRTQLLVTGATELGASATTVVHLREREERRGAVEVTIYLPSGYVANLGQSGGYADRHGHRERGASRLARRRRRPRHDRLNTPAQCTVLRALAARRVCGASQRAGMK